MLTCPAGRAEVKIWIVLVAAFMVMLMTELTDWAGEPASLTCTVNAKLPAWVGIPAIWPDAETLKPVGKEPVVIDQLYGAVPPLADRDAE